MAPKKSKKNTKKTVPKTVPAPDELRPPADAALPPDATADEVSIVIMNMHIKQPFQLSLKHILL